MAKAKGITCGLGIVKDRGWNRGFESVIFEGGTSSVEWEDTKTREGKESYCVAEFF